MISTSDSLKEHVAKVVKFYLRELIREKYAQEPNFDAYLRDVVDHGVYELCFEKRAIAIEKFRIEIHKHWPKNWIEAFKERWFPGWLLKRYPVQYDRVDVSQPIYGPVCPHVRLRDEQDHWRFITLDVPLEPYRAEA